MQVNVHLYEEKASAILTNELQNQTDFDRNVSLASGWFTIVWLPDLSSAHSTSFDEGSGNWGVSHVLCFSGPPSLPPGELALQGCTVHVYDQGPVTLQKVHSTIAEHLQELRHQGLLGEEQQLRVSELATLVLRVLLTAR